MIEPYTVCISPKLYHHIFDNLDPSLTDPEAAMTHFCNEIARQATIFCNRFNNSYFLGEEPVHEFIGYTWRDDASRVTEELKCRIIFGEPREANVCLQSELPLDDMYDVRTIIAESQLPEYWDDKVVKVT